MTREEAKHWLEIELKTWEDECKSKHPIKEALSVAIEALEQESTIEEEYEYIYIGNGAYEKRPKVKSELTTKNDLGVDAVSRQELLKIYEDRFLELQKLKHLKDNKGAEDRQMGVNYCINILKELPPVTPIRPKGHWIARKKVGFGEWKDVTVLVNLKGCVTDSCECSECGEWLTGSDEYECSARYCPNCGAEMESEE
jgi:hypothetical protein